MLPLMLQHEADDLAGPANVFLADERLCALLVVQRPWPLDFYGSYCPIQLNKSPWRFLTGDPRPGRLFRRPKAAK